MVIRMKIGTLLKIQIVLLVLSGLFIGKPLYHLLKERYLRLQAEKIWEKISDYGQKNAFVPVAWLKIPKIDMSTLVIKGNDKKSLDKFPCLIPTTSANDGLKLILAHRDLHFATLKKLNVQDIIFWETKNKQPNTYVIKEIEILTPDAAYQKIKAKINENWLILQTCYPFKYIGAAPKRFVVWAQPLKE